MTSARANRRGMFAIMGAMAFFAVNDMLIKLTAQRNPLGEVLTVRGAMATVLVGGVFIATGHLGALRFTRDWHVLGRTALDGAAMVLFTLALVHMPLAELSAMNLLTPLLITALAVVFFAEDVGWRRWTAIIVGFIGTLFIVKPAPGNFNAWAMLGLCCSFAAASRDIVTRHLDPRIPTLVISLMAAIGSAVIGFVMSLFEDWQPMSLEDAGLLAISAGCVGIGHFLIVIAFRGVDVTAIAPFRYTLLIWAVICGYLAFGEVPDKFAIFGAALIVGSGLYALHREVVRRRTLAGGVPPAEPGA